MSISENNFIEAPEPLFKYNGKPVIHDDNLAILSMYEDAPILSKKEVASLKTELTAINEAFKMASVDTYLARLDEYKRTFNSLKINYNSLMLAYKDLETIYSETESQYLIFILIITKRICHALEEIKADVPSLKRAIKRVNFDLAEYRDDIRRRHKIRQQLKSHYAAVDDKKKTDLLQKGMAEEATIIVEQMKRTLSRLGFSHTYTIGKNTKTDLVEFDHVVVTPDQHQCKIFASKQGLWGGSIDMLPHGVFVTEIIKPKVMQELSVTLEREVWSPHTSEDNFPLMNGAWIVVERLGLVEGIPKAVTYKQLMARYETADHSKFPIPAGLRRGRRVNWVYLDSPSGIHLMFTGISGSGKSNGMRAMVSCVVEKQSPNDINFAFVDLKKQGDFREFETAPHCIKSGDKGVLTEINEVVEILQRVRAEMHARQTRIGQVANNLIDYNKRVQPEHRMPRIVVVFDEYANTRRARFTDEANIIDDICIEIGQVGRAAGISLWIGIQQPRRDNMPSPLRDNITTQFVGHQANVGAAQSATGNRDSLKLEDFPGRMSANVGWKTEKVQMPFISEDDVKLAVQIARDNYGNSNPYQLATPDTKIEAHKSNEDIVLELAFTEFEGNLKIYPMYKALDGEISRGAITKIVNQFAEQKTIEYNGKTYDVRNQRGNYYALVIADDND